MIDNKHKNSVAFKIEHLRHYLFIGLFTCFAFLIFVFVYTYLKGYKMTIYTNFYWWCIFVTLRCLIIEPIYLTKNPEFVKEINCDKKAINKRGIVYSVIETAMTASVFLIFRGADFKIKLIFTIIFFIIHAVLLLSFINFLEKTYPEEKSETGQ